MLLNIISQWYSHWLSNKIYLESKEKEKKAREKKRWSDYNRTTAILSVLGFVWKMIAITIISWLVSSNVSKLVLGSIQRLTCHTYLYMYLYIYIFVYIFYRKRYFDFIIALNEFNLLKPKVASTFVSFHL